MIRVRRGIQYFDFKTSIFDFVPHLAEIAIETSCRSNDLLVTVHANQDKRATGRILWTNIYDNIEVSF